MKLSQKFTITKNIDDIISSSRPPIFWKDKEIVKQQINSWSFNNTERLVYKISNIELMIKKNSTNSINILSNFILEQVAATSN